MIFDGSNEVIQYVAFVCDRKFDHLAAAKFLSKFLQPGVLEKR